MREGSRETDRRWFFNFIHKINTPLTMKLLPFIALPKPLRGADDARQFDADTFDAHQALVGYVRPMIQLEFIGAPQALRHALAQPLMRPFRHVVQVRRGGGLFENERQVLQVQMMPDFDSSRDGLLRKGFLMNAPTDRPPSPKSPGELSHLLYAPPSS